MVEPNGPRWPAYVTRLHLQSIRGFSDLDLSFSDGGDRPRMRTLVIGKNGTCKTTLLRSLALGLANAFEGSALLEGKFPEFVQHGADTGTISVFYTRADRQGSSSSITRRLHRKQQLENGQWGPVNEAEGGWSPFFVAYGAGRFSGGEKARSPSRYSAASAAAGLFNQTLPLSDPELTLRRLRDFQGTHFYERTLAGIKALLGLSEEDSIEVRKGGGVEVSGPSVGEPIELDAWADGYRVTFTWLLDFYGWAMTAGAIDEEGVVRGLLLVDELEQHLHPSMQAQVLPRLSKLLPAVQIVATTHSPLTALGAEPEELVALHRRSDGTVEVVSAPDYRLYSAEDMLTDERLFDTSPYSEAVRQANQEYVELAAIPAPERQTAEESRLRSLAQRLSSGPEQDDPAVAALAEMKSILARHGIS
ncbi:MAG: AAA family ATPase [Acidobacteria bacterium]|nr:AAA family ATPase [Acidobacteriota bacterium]